jgi:hypothetical protein
MSEKPHADENTRDLFWQLLMEVESHTRPEDVLGKMLVEAGYRRWKLLHPESRVKPRWEK